VGSVVQSHDLARNLTLVQSIFVVLSFVTCFVDKLKAAVVAGVAASISWCFCTAFTSLLGSCCGNDKASTVAAGPSSGRKRSVCLLFISICISLGFQYGLAPYFVKSSTLSTFTTYFQDSWIDGCQQYNNNPVLLERCATNNGNFRVSAATTLFFVLAGIAATCRQSANREAWPAKFVLYLFLVAATAAVPSDPIFSQIYLYIARGTSLFYLFIRKIQI
jgi:Serine incorporator (Serinc)